MLEQRRGHFEDGLVLGDVHLAQRLCIGDLPPLDDDGPRSVAYNVGQPLFPDS